MSIVTASSWAPPASTRDANPAPRVSRVWHQDEHCSRALKREVVAHDVPITSAEAGLPCSYCVDLPPCQPRSMEQQLRALLAVHRPDVDFDAHVATLQARGDWTPQRVARALRHYEAKEQP